MIFSDIKETKWSFFVTAPVNISDRSILVVAFVAVTTVLVAMLSDLPAAADDF